MIASPAGKAVRRGARPLTALATVAAAGVVVGVVPTPAIAQSVLVADWEMNEGPGATTMTDSAGHSPGTLQDVTATSSGFYTFNGVDSIVTATQNFSIGSADMSFTARLRFNQIPNSNVGDYDVVRGAPTGKWKLEIVRRENGTVARANCRFSGTSGGKNLAEGPSLADGQWHTVTCSKTSNTINLTVDGVQFHKSFTAGAINTTGKQIALGGQTSGEDAYMGDLDYVQVSVG